MDKPTDEQLITRCLNGQQSAFEILVQRYQVLVCSIAYSIVGNVSSSEDVGQEAFLQAWKKLGDLRSKEQFKSWISSITRNEARAWLRRRANSMQGLEEPAHVPQKTREDDVVDQDEADLVWKTLSELPESYREPLVLYYRNDQSVSEVAEALSLSQSATKQRLARGREMLRAEVLATIEQRLRRTVPTAAFTVGVMALVSGTSKTAAAATGAATAKLATSAAKSAAGGAAAGTLIGLIGGCFGAFASWYTAEYQSQRKLIVRQGIVYLIGMSIFMLPFLAMQVGWRPTATLGVDGYRTPYTIWMLFFFSLNCAWVFWAIRSHKTLQKKERHANTERLPRHKRSQEEGRTQTGRRWTSSQSLLGLPLVQIAFPDRYVGIDDATVEHQGTARAWIAIGHFAFGRIVAIGHRAIAPLSVGSQSIGIVSFGGFSVGLASLGVLSIGPLAAGVVSIGGITVGGAIAAGFLAVAPLAFALKAAKGAMVFSLQFAEGPVAFAPHANDEVAEQYMASSAVVHQLDQWLHSVVHSSGGSGMAYWIAGLVILISVVQRFVLTQRAD